MRAQIERLHRDLPAEAQVAVLGPDGKAAPLTEKREIGRLLELGDEQPRPERVRHAGRHVDDVAGTHRDPVQRAEKPVDVLLVDPLEVALGLDRLAEADPDLGLLVARIENDPRLRLPEGRAERLERKVAVGMRVDGQPLGGVEQLHEQPGRRPVGGHVLVTQPRDRIRFHNVTKEAAVGETRQSLLRIVPAGIPRRRHRADPVLGKDVVRPRAPRAACPMSAPPR